MVPYLKERGRTNGWYVAKKAGNACKIKACRQRREAQRKERRKIHGVAFFPLVLLLLFQTQN